MSSLQCDFCWHQCVLSEGKTGICGIRKHTGNSLVTLGFGEVVASGVDPIEKKPMYHFLPGRKTFSFALFGCNYTCRFCQNHRISQTDSPSWPGRTGHSTPNPTTPRKLVDMMERSGCQIMSYTYSEPLVWQDYMLEVATLVRDKGKLNCMVTNGSFSPRALQRILGVIDAFNIDVKGDDRFYREYCGGALQPVLDAVETIAARRDTVLEVTTLLIEGIHTERMVKTLARQLADRGVQVWHLSRFFPHYRMTALPQTSEGFLEEMLLIAEAVGIPHVYAGNSALYAWEKTVCPACHKTLIHSHSYAGEAFNEIQQNIPGGVCASCGQRIYGRFD